MQGNCSHQHISGLSRLAARHQSYPLLTWDPPPQDVHGGPGNTELPGIGPTEDQLVSRQRSRPQSGVLTKME